MFLIGHECTNFLLFFFDINHNHFIRALVAIKKEYSDDSIKYQSHLLLVETAYFPAPVKKKLKLISI